MTTTKTKQNKTKKKEISQSMDEDIEEVNQKLLISLCENRGYGPPHYDISSVGDKHTAVVSVEFRTFQGLTCSLLCNAKENAAGMALKFYETHISTN